MYDKRSKYLSGLVVTDNDGGIPLGGALRPVHFHPEADEDAWRRQQDALAILHLSPLSDRARP